MSAWIQLGSVAGLDELIAMGDAAVFRPRYPKRGDARPFADLDGLRVRVNEFRGRGKRRLAAALDLVREGVESPMETALRLLLIRDGLPEPEVNVDIRTPSGGFAGRADLYYPEFRLIVEYDGEQHRFNREIYAEDQRRIARLIEAGETVQRVRIEGLRSEAPVTLCDVRTALTAAGWRPPNPHRLGSSCR
ncbi:hypothetical protein B7R21_11710 [Subtercola boreus]|uniref:DUF559 domain-containing protein n=1 Tax=Subtercola boreus TaxID=120213 RepID=A0A3E0VPT4_9MICO|nr:hypothetical protein B7R21_11710 [Subtercola boreus]